ncbi:SprT family zinc-dependent metalloprotease [Arcicella sp. DC2W]|uniref:SprT family zinc-dependent metalloprotease n=1 Tax=Arcicella gelida TaxID=2984195 RepID=A0ABU5S471_9BACT|nr:SprT family zinc-dependent metalloprotease [Arcicella sp. DC2W]MEA5403246.1 SprT family zinc-dependent metalloprotease [Arcicella sp. DC2W]
MYQINLSDFTIDVVRKNIKNMHLSVYPPTGRVRIAAPLNIDDEAVRLFAISKLGWIKRHQRNFAKQERQSPRIYKTRESHYYQGKRYLLKVIEHEAPNKVLLKNRTYLELYVRPDTSIQQRQAILNEWYRTELKKLVQPIIDIWEKRMGVQVEDWQVKQMKTKWGTCNIEKKRIWLNLELAKKPINCLEYIIVHEMVHLLERHHNDRFLYYMDTFLPNWKQLKSELNTLPVSHADWEY